MNQLRLIFVKEESLWDRRERSMYLSHNVKLTRVTKQRAEHHVRKTDWILFHSHLSYWHYMNLLEQREPFTPTRKVNGANYSKNLTVRKLEQTHT